MKDLRGKYVHCETMEQAEELMKEAEKQGFKVLTPSNIQVYDENTVYNFSKPNKEVWYGGSRFYKSQGIEIVEFKYMLDDSITVEDVESLVLTFLDLLPENELLKEKLRLSKMILNYKE